LRKQIVFFVFFVGAVCLPVHLEATPCRNRPRVQTLFSKIFSLAKAQGVRTLRRMSCCGSNYQYNPCCQPAKTPSCGYAGAPFRTYDAGSNVTPPVPVTRYPFSTPPPASLLPQPSAFAQGLLQAYYASNP
jgi:hypothetical protein